MGIVLPLVVALSMYGNIDAGFSMPEEARRRQGQSQSGAVRLWVLSQLRLLLEWAVVPMFAISLQLPQGTEFLYLAGCFAFVFMLLSLTVSAAPSYPHPSLL